GLRDNFLLHPSRRAMGAGRELRARRRDGSEFPVEIGLNPLPSAGETLVLASVIDISERKRTEESARQLLAELNESISVLAASSEGILAATSQVASGTQEIATAISEIATTVEQVKQTAVLASTRSKAVVDSTAH